MGFFWASAGMYLTISDKSTIFPEWRNKTMMDVEFLGTAIISPRPDVSFPLLHFNIL